MKTSVTKICFLCFLLMPFLMSGFVAAEESNDIELPIDPNFPVDVNSIMDPNLLGGYSIPGTVEGTGTRFEITDSNYLNITLESNEPIQVRMESIPEIVTIQIKAAADDANSTEITLSGFEPNTIYYKYEDSYHNDVNFTTDDNGSYSYTQDLIKPHLIFIQPEPSTRYIPTDTWMGIWDPCSRTYTLTKDVSGTIQIDQNDLTLDGNGHIVTGAGGSTGIYLNQRTGVTIKNLTVQVFRNGIYMYKSGGITLTGSDISSNSYCGIYLYNSEGVTLADNEISSNSSYGVQLYNCGGITLTDNTIASNSTYGIYLYYNQSEVSTGVTMRRNTISGSQCNFAFMPDLWYSTNPAQYDHDIDTTNTVDGKPIYYIKDVVGTAENPVVYDSSTNAGSFYAISCDNITVKDLTLTDNYYGLLFCNTRNSTIENITATNNASGVTLGPSSNGNLLTNSNVSLNSSHGIYMANCYNNTLTNNTSNSNGSGIYLWASGATMTGNTCSNNSSYGIGVVWLSSATMTGNTVLNNNRGIYISTGGPCTLRNNIMAGNTYNFGVTGAYGGYDSHFRNDIDTSNTVDGKILYYVVKADNTVYDNTTAPNAGAFYALECNNITVKDMVLDGNCCDGVFFRRTYNSTIENVTATNAESGITIWYSNNNTLTGNTVSGNLRGIYFYFDSHGNTLTGNTVSDNEYQGISLSNSCSNTLTNNMVNSNTYGITITSSGNPSWVTDGVSTLNTLHGNTIFSSHQYNFQVSGKEYSHFDQDIDTTNTVEGKPIYYIKKADGEIYDGSANGGVFYAIDCNNITITAQTLANNYYGVFFFQTCNSTIENVTCSNSRSGIYLDTAPGSTLIGNTVSDSSSYGIYLSYADNSTLTDNTVSSSNSFGIYIYNSENSTLTGNTANSNTHYGINLQNSSNSVLTGNTANLNYNDGIYLQNSGSSVLADNTASSNSQSGIGLSNCSNSTLINNTAFSNGKTGIGLGNSGNSVLVCNTANSDNYGIWLQNSGNSVLTGNTANLNYYDGIVLYSCSDSTLTDNTVASNNRYGMRLYNSSNNEVYHNNFIDNVTQVTPSYGNTFYNTDGGNYWSNWCPPEHPDMDGDGFVDEPYVFSGCRDNLPLVSQVPSICNQSPVADAGVGQTVHPGDVVTLDGSASSDPDEDYPLTYAWQITSTPEGSIAELWDHNMVSPTFVPDLMGDYTIELVVTDSLGAQSAPDSVLISTYNTAPIADAGEDQALLYLNTAVQLGTDPGRQSYDEDGDPITYLWTITNKPEGSIATLDDPTSATPTFEADVYGAYMISLIVTDNFGATSVPDAMTVSFTNVKPVADAGGNQAAVAGDTILLDGSGSHDDNGDPLSYSWSLVSKPEGSVTEIADPTSVQTSFVADQAGTYVVSLIVNDGFLNSDADNVTIEVITVCDALVQTLLDLIDVVNALDPSSLKNVNMMKNPMTNKINAVLNKIDRGFYDEALDKLQNDILQKTNGCAEIGEPDKNDWIITCEAQDQVYPLIMSAIALLEELI